MKKRQPTPPRASKAELACVEQRAAESAFERLDRGDAEILSPSDYPEPLRQFIEKHRGRLTIELSAQARRRLDAASKRQGIRPEDLVRRWIRDQLTREAG